MIRILTLVAGTLLLVAGLISSVTPMPGATFMLALGAVLLICASPAFRHCVQVLRTRFPRFNSFVSWVTRRVGKRMGGVLELTEPGHVMKDGDHGA